MSTLSAIAKIGAPAVGALAGLTASRDADAMFLGPSAKMADEMMYMVARKMKSEGYSPDEIFSKTNWFQDPVDKQWKWELSDRGADWAGTKHGFKDAYPNYREYKVDPNDPADNDIMDIEDIFEHDDLYANYPQLKHLTVDRDAKGNVLGSYSSFEDRISINTDKPQAEARSTMLHELQHAVQDIEGFSSGGSPQQFTYSEANKVAGIARKKKKHRKAVYEQLENHRNKLHEMGLNKRDANGEMIMHEDFTFEKNATPEEIKKQEEVVAFWRKRLKEIDQDIKDTMDYYLDETPHAHYQRLGGETEARNVQSRDIHRRVLDNLKPGDEHYGAMARDIPPWESASFPPEKQFLKPEDSPAHYTRHKKIPKYKSPYANLAEIAQHGTIKPTAHPGVAKTANFFYDLEKRMEGHPLGLLTPGSGTGNWLMKLANQQKPSWMDRAGALMDWL